MGHYASEMNSADSSFELEMLRKRVSALRDRVNTLEAENACLRRSIDAKEPSVPTVIEPTADCRCTAKDVGKEVQTDYLRQLQRGLYALAGKAKWKG